MRVLAFTPAYPPGSRVGAWLATHEFLRHLAQQGHDVTVVPMANTVTSEFEGVQIRPKNEFRALLEDADVVISHAGDVRDFAHRPAVRMGKPSVRMVHGSHPGRSALEGAALVVFNAQTTAATCRWDGPSIVCHPPVDPTEYRVTPGDKVTLVNLSEAKGVDTFTACARHLSDVRFLGVRGGYGIQSDPAFPNVEIVGVTRDMRDIYSRTRILLAPSVKESWGRVGVEAMCSGIPVIAHPTPGLVESLGDAGVFVDRGDIDGWCREITRLSNPDEWAAASARALRRSAELHPVDSLERFTEAVEALVAVPV